jgi:hypothetical protein
MRVRSFSDQFDALSPKSSKRMWNTPAATSAFDPTATLIVSCRDVQYAHIPNAFSWGDTEPRNGTFVPG